MASKKIRLKGHETFILREGWITKALSCMDNPDFFAVNYGADDLGVGTNMAKAIRYWMREGNFINDQPRQPRGLTTIGEIIKEYDLYIEDIFALWIFHINLVSKEETATSWYLLFNSVEAEEFTKEELFALLHQRIETMVEGQDISDRSLNDDCNALTAMYVKEHIENYDPEDKKISPFSVLGLMKRDGKKYKMTQPETKALSESVVLYILQKYFDEKKTNSVSIDDLLRKENLPGRVLNMKRVMLNDYLDLLAEQKYIVINRTAGLDMVYKNCELTPDDVVREYYQREQ